ncbi:gas vesicle protein GvpH [Halobium salinum]|uniref:Gas vesicle protein GvpH n=1 Tax=Halobium salinum TaxID=1364940 RepID=A0ABD5PHF3_9EURY|nr:gas vesicle protein GvpH [Halobium salinum]
MTPGRGRDNDANGPGGDDRDDGREDEPRGLFGALRRLADTLVDLDAGARTGTGSGGPGTPGSRGRPEGPNRVVGGDDTGRFEYRFGVSTLDDLLAASEAEEAEEADGASRYGRIDPPTSVHEGPEGVVVHVDLPEVEGDTVAAGVDGGTLYVGVGSEVLTRVQLPREGLEVQHGTYNNGVLEFFLRDGGSEDGERDDEDAGDGASGERETGDA